MPDRRAVLGALVAGSAGCLAPASRRGSEIGDRLPADASARIGFGGDAMLGRSVDARWRDGPPGGVWGSLRDRLDDLDGLVTNLECSISNRGTADPDRVYTFRASPDWAIDALEAAGVAAVSLANNHQLDFGPAALYDTVDHLDDAGIAASGAGTDREAATRPTTATVGGLDVAMIAATDQARRDAAGADDPGVANAPLSAASPESRAYLGELLDRARATDPDLLVASLHWGPNWRERPSGSRRRLAAWLIDRGVDAVHGHSAHVVQGVETYRGRPILYDAGDLVDDYVVKEDLRNDRSALFELVVADGALSGVRIVPTRIEDSAVDLAPRDVAAWIRDRIRRRSRDFGTTFERAGDGLWVPLAADRPPSEP